MTERDLPLTPAEEALLDFSLGHTDQCAENSLEATSMRELVSQARLDARSAADVPSNALIESVREAARESVPQPSFWRLLEGGLRTNMLVRIVAASLVIHLAALPVLAWLQFSQKERGPIYIQFEKPEPVLVDQPAPELLEPVNIDELPEWLELLDQPLTSPDQD